MQSVDVNIPRLNKSGRPFGISILAICLGLISLVALGRSVWLWTNVRYVWSLSGPVLTWYLLNASLPYGLLCPPAALLLWRGQPAGRVYTLVLLGLGTLHYWLDKLLITANPFSRIDWPFALVVNGLVLCAVWILLMNRHAQHFFQEE